MPFVPVACVSGGTSQISMKQQPIRELELAATFWAIKSRAESVLCDAKILSKGEFNQLLP
jgi:hypothetical protein